MARKSTPLLLFWLVAIFFLVPTPPGAAQPGNMVVYWDFELSGNSPGTQIAWDTGAAEWAADHVNQLLRLPEELPVYIVDDPEPDAYYDPMDRSIVMTSGLFEMFWDMAQSAGGDTELLVFDSILFTAFHEVGHALIDIYLLPATGREEDVADQISSWIILTTVGETEAEGIEVLLNSAYFFLTEVGKNPSLEELAFWDTHPHDHQRYYNMVCWCDGYDRGLTEQVLGQPISAILPEEREVFCEEEYALLDDALYTLLGDYLIE